MDGIVVINNVNVYSYDNKVILKNMIWYRLVV